MNNYQEIIDKATEEGHKALWQTKPNPVGWVQADLDDKPIGKTYIVDEGLCGGAYIILTDSRSEFVKWCKTNDKLSIDKNIGGKGYTISTFDAHRDYRGQSAERYEACAEAFAKVLQENGVDCMVHAYLT